MPNTILTPSIIARVALSLLRSTLVMGSLVYRDYSSEYQKKGATITIRKPPVFTVQNLTTEAAGAGITTQTVTETSETLTLDQWKGVRFAITSKEEAYSIDDLAQRVVKPAILPIVEDIDSYLLGLYTQIPYWYGTAGTTPSVLSDLAGVGKILAENKCPTDDMALVVNPAAQAELWPVMANMNVAKPQAENPALTRAQIGMVNNLNTFMDQNVRTHNAGGDLSVNINNGAGYAIGATAISLKNISADLVVGDLLTIGAYQHVIVTAGAIGGGIQACTIYPALKASVADNDAVTVVADHVANLAFHRNGIALATAPLEPPRGGARGESVIDEETGFTCRVVYDWDNTVMSNVCTLDILYGAKVIYKELCARLLG